MINKIIYKNEIAAVVVTYNRLKLLMKVINGLLNQTLQPNRIIIINNNSTDGTADWLTELSKKYSHITTITQDNTGSSGGQYTGTNIAYTMGYEWIWIMDDDVVPTTECLQNLMLHCKPDVVSHPLGIGPDNKPIDVDVRGLNTINPFKRMFKHCPFTEDELKADFISIDVVTFEGPIFHHSMFKKVGFPDKKIFIYADDTEFSIRLKKCGIHFVKVPKATLNRLLFLYRKIDFNDWKFYYVIRNLTIIDNLYGNIPVKFIRPVLRILPKIFKCRKLSQLKTLFRALYDGYFYKQEN